MRVLVVNAGSSSVKLRLLDGRDQLGALGGRDLLREPGDEPLSWFPRTDASTFPPGHAAVTTASGRGTTAGSPARVRANDPPPGGGSR